MSVVQPYEYHGYAMDTEITIKIMDRDNHLAIDGAKDEINRLEKKLSRFIKSSEISRINNSAGKEAVNVSSETLDLLSEAKKISEISLGAFDITAAPLIDLWKNSRIYGTPDKESIRRALSLVDQRDLILDNKKNKAFLKKSGQMIDLGGIGKGYAGDCCIKKLKEGGISSAFLSIGGNVCTMGKRKDGKFFRVGIRHPRKKDALMGAFEVSELSGKSVVTSGDYERCFIDKEGKRVHHIIDISKGMPACSGLISVSVIHKSGMIADALSTAVFAAGIKKGKGFIEEVKGAEAILMDVDQSIFVTKGIRKSFQAASEKEIKTI